MNVKTQNYSPCQSPLEVSVPFKSSVSVFFLRNNYNEEKINNIAINAIQQLTL